MVNTSLDGPKIPFISATKAPDASIPASKKSTFGGLLNTKNDLSASKWATKEIEVNNVNISIVPSISTAELSPEAVSVTELSSKNLKKVQNTTLPVKANEILRTNANLLPISLETLENQKYNLQSLDNPKKNDKTTKIGEAALIAGQEKHKEVLIDLTLTGKKKEELSKQQTKVKSIENTIPRHPKLPTKGVNPRSNTKKEPNPNFWNNPQKARNSKDQNRENDRLQIEKKAALQMRNYKDLKENLKDENYELGFSMLNERALNGVDLLIFNRSMLSRRFRNSALARELTVPMEEILRHEIDFRKNLESVWSVLQSNYPIAQENLLDYTNSLEEALYGYSSDHKQLLPSLEEIVNDLRRTVTNLHAKLAQAKDDKLAVFDPNIHQNREHYEGLIESCVSEEKQAEQELQSVQPQILRAMKELKSASFKSHLSDSIVFCDTPFDILYKYAENMTPGLNNCYVRFQKIDSSLADAFESFFRTSRIPKRMDDQGSLLSFQIIDLVVPAVLCVFDMSNSNPLKSQLRTHFYVNIKKSVKEDPQQPRQTPWLAENLDTHDPSIYTHQHKLYSVEYVSKAYPSTYGADWSRYYLSILLTSDKTPSITSSGHLSYLRMITHLEYCTTCNQHDHVTRGCPHTYHSYCSNNHHQTSLNGIRSHR